MELLGVDTRQEGGWTILSLTGQLDVATAPRVRQSLIEAQYSAASRVVLDLSGVEFIDSMGLGVIIGGLKRARSHHGELVIVCDRERILHIFEITRIESIVRIVPTIGDALHA